MTPGYLAQGGPDSLLKLRASMGGGDAVDLDLHLFALRNLARSDVARYWRRLGNSGSGHCGDATEKGVGDVSCVDDVDLSRHYSEVENDSMNNYAAAPFSESTAKIWGLSSEGRVASAKARAGQNASLARAT